MRLSLPHVLAVLLAAGCAGAGAMRPADVGTELVEVMTPDGFHLNGALWKAPGAPGSRPALFLVHGYAGNFYTGWPGLARALAQQGHLTLALNMRDHDLSAQHIVSLRGPDTRSDPFLNIARIRVPVLILHGTADRLADPAVAERLKAAASAAPSVQLHLIPGADHGLPNYPDVLLTILEPWLEAVSK